MDSIYNKARSWDIPTQPEVPVGGYEACQAQTLGCWVCVERTVGSNMPAWV